MILDTDFVIDVMENEPESIKKTPQNDIVRATPGNQRPDPV